MADKGKAVAYSPLSSDFNKDTGSLERKEEGREVLTFSFLVSMCYAATSYPHPIDVQSAKTRMSHEPWQCEYEKYFS